jgi:hypothetical protein
MLPLVLTLIGASPVFAQQPVASLEEARPRLTQVSNEHRRAATALVEEGNTLLHESRFPEAEMKYSAALALWEHPAIHYNLALAIPQTLRPAEIYEHLLAATQHGDGPLGTGRYKHARNLTERMEAEYAQVEISCDCEASAKLSSGEWLVRKGSGRFEGLVPPGTHILVAALKDHPPTEKALTLRRGERVRLRLGEKRPYSTWRILATLGAGAAVTVGGGVLHSQAAQHFRAFDDGINRCGGCAPDPSLGGQRTRAITLQRVAFGSYALGGAAVLTGLVFLYNNQLQSQVIPSEHGEMRFVIAPVLDQQRSGLLAIFQF